MEKDTARLREQEAEVARERIAKMKTEEESKMELVRLEQSRRAAQERKIAEEETKKKERDLERLKMEREGRAAAAEMTAAEKAEKEKELLKERLREAQLKEERERKEFLEKVSAKAEGWEAKEKRAEPPSVPPPVPPSPVPPPMPPAQPATPILPTPKKPSQFPKPKLPSVQMPKIRGYFPDKSSLFEKIWIRIVVSLFILAILATLITFWYWYLAVRPAAPTSPETPVAPVEKPKPAELVINEKILRFGYHIPSEPRTIDTIIIHSVYNAFGGDAHSIEGVIEEYKIYKVAAHYLIARDGKIYQTAPREAIAYHAGVSQMPDGRTNANDFSVGIELIYTKEETPTETQYESLSQLVNYLQKEYDIPAKNILGHKDIAPGRKDDPWNFDWNLLTL